ncbi:MAG TPA: patatin-like phospholipase family protein [Dermatophilaceae bacterium]|nr:patatin-like phospholipase family protein [Dermatophilaceae bacterium]
MIEGGVARGAVSGGMAMRLHELGLAEAFDDVYGSSAGAISAAWLASSTPERLVGWADPAYVRMLIRRHGPLRRQPIVDVKSLVEVVYTRHAPMDFPSIVTSPLRWHPIGTDAQNGDAVDLRPWVRSGPDVQLAIRASAAIPLLAGGPVTIGDREYFDAGVAEPVPYRVAAAAGATHLLVLRSRQTDDVPRLSPVASGVARTALRGYGHGFRSAFRTSSARYALEHARLCGHSAMPAGTPPTAVIAPAPGSATVGRMGRETQLLAAAFEAGRTAVETALTAVSSACS